MDGSVRGSRALARAERPIEGPFGALLASFHRQGIVYCYWKSRRRVRDAWSGQSDLDLLVARDDQHRAQICLLQAGFKCFAPVSPDHPAICSFLGHDEAGGRVVHVHLHARLVVGGTLLKTHRLPWEDGLLARAVPHPALPIRVLDPTDEALLILVRESLELRWTDPVILRHWSRTRRKFAADRQACAEDLDLSALLNRVRELLSDEVAGAIQAATFGEAGPAALHRLKRRIRGNLRPWRLGNKAEQHLRTLGRAASRVAGELAMRLFRVARPWRRHAPGGGVVVTLVGVDGSGKTTAMMAVRAWLEAEVDAMPIYFGTGGGRPSLLLLPLKIMLPLVMIFFRSKPRGSSHGRVSDRPPGPVYSLLMMAWAGVLAVEKRMKLVAARRGAERGLVVIADRYPQDEDLTYNDGPLLPRLRWVPGWLRAFEARCYALARHLPPDLVIKLDVSAETAARREPDMDATIIRTRVAALRRLAFPGAKVVRIDAEQPLAAVLTAVKREIWQVL